MVASKSYYRPDIDGLRALAVLSVLVYHVNPTGLPGGFLGVDVFFVISGYLISLMLFEEMERGRLDFPDFYSRRIRRLLPALIVVLACTLLFGALALFADEYERLGQHCLYAILFLLNFHLMSEAGYFDVASEAKPLLHLWSLSVEEQFYLLWPVSLLAIFKMRLRPGWALGVLGAASFAFFWHMHQIGPDKLYFHSFSRFWELLLGAGLAYWHRQKGKYGSPFFIEEQGLRHVVSVLGVVALLWGLIAMNSAQSHTALATIVPVLGTVGLIASGQLAIANRMLSARPLVIVGLMSYPLYLWHWPILSYLRITESGAPAVWMLWCGAGFSFVLAALTYRFVEKPLQHFRDSTKALWVLSSALVGLLAVSVIITSTGGLPARPSVAYVKGVAVQMKRGMEQSPNCLARFAERMAPVYCLQSGRTDQMIAVIGDSHAHVLFDGVAKLADDLHFGTLLLANSGCPPLAGTVTGWTSIEKTKCAANIATILNEIDSAPNIKAVLIATRGPKYLTGEGFGSIDVPYPKIVLEVGDVNLPSREVFKLGLVNSINRLSKSGKVVVYLLENPELGISSKDCLGRPVSWGSKSSCAVNYSVYKKRMAEYRSVVGEVREMYEPGTFRVVDTEPLFCDQSSCSGMRDGNLLYADDNHLSSWGASYVAPLIVNSLDIADLSGK